MKKLSKNTHLNKEDIIKNGSIFTPERIVNLVFDMVKPYIDEKAIIGDFCSGYGAFINKFNELPNQCFGTEFDPESYLFLIQNYNNKIFLENSLDKINRKKYDLKEKDELIVVGNPPYNDITSQYKKGEKGEIFCDEDVKSRDMGMSFLKAYSKLNAKYICVLHPLSYIIKKQNFNSLKQFKDNYKLIDATIFSSKEFESIKNSNSNFPVIAALYVRDKQGMNYEYINDFNFKILDSKKIFKLKDISTIDGIINKYPTKDTYVDVQFYPQRDMNSLLRNTSFIIGKPGKGINVTIDNLYQYCWLFFLKNNFKPKKNEYLYGNLSPLYIQNIENKNIKNCLVSYAYNNNNLIKQFFNKKDIEKKYNFLTTDYSILYNLLEKLYIFDK